MENAENICRICLAGGSTDIDRLLINIFQPKDDHSELGFPTVEALQVICGLEVSEDDNYPKQICSMCHSRLEEAYYLRQQSQESQETLANIISKATTCELYAEEVNEDRLYEIEYLEDQDMFEVGVEESIANVKLEGEIILEKIVEKPIFTEQAASGDSTRIHCCGCPTSFDTELELRKHSVWKHRDRKPVATRAGKIQCNVCFLLFTNEYTLDKHKEGKNDLTPLQKCEFCGCNFLSSTGLAIHQDKFHPNRLFSCCVCYFTSIDKNELLIHANSHRSKNRKIDNTMNTMKYKCSMCDARFKTVNEKRVHTRLPYRKYRISQKVKDDQMTTMTVVRCCGCPKVFITIQELQTHQEEVHLPKRQEEDTSDFPVQCGGCYKRFKNNGFLNKHLRRAADKKLYACSKCSVARRTLMELMEHEATHTGGGAFICCGCRQGFETHEALEHHSLEVHANRPKVYYNDEDDTERPFECKICYRRYKSARDLRGHQRFVYYEKAHICDVCGKGFAQENTLDIHLATHKTDAEFECPICSKKFKHEAFVRNCIVRHERPKIHKCKICNVTFPAASNLYSHMVSHSEDRRYKCDVCGQTFKRSFHLRKHKNTHTSEKNYPCKYCPSRFCSTTELYKHEIRHTGLYPYQCDFCNKKLTTRQIFIKHYEAHLDDSAKTFECHLCPLRYSQDHFLSNHIKYNHRIEPQDKNWNDKFNRQGPSRKKGGVRVAGVRGNISTGSVPHAVIEEEIVDMNDVDQLDAIDVISEELEILE